MRIDLHLLIVHSNAAYILAAAAALAVLEGRERFAASAALVAVAVVSIVRHSNEATLGLSQTFWRYADIALALATLIGGGATMGVAWKRGLVDRGLALASLVSGALALGLFWLSHLAARRLTQLGEPPSRWDPTSGYLCPSVEDAEDAESEAQRATLQTLYLTSHAAWHLIGGVTLLMVILALRGPCPRKASSDRPSFDDRGGD